MKRITDLDMPHLRAALTGSPAQKLTTNETSQL